MINYLIIALIGLIAQIIDGGLGMGYGITSTSMLLTLGLSTALASATVHTAEIFTTLVSGVSHLKMGNVDKKIFVPLTLSGIVGGIVGVYLSVNLQNTEAIRPFVSIILFILGGLIVYRFAINKHSLQHQVPRKGRLILIGFPAALIDAIGGGGWGPIATPSLIIHNSHPKKAIGSVNLAEFFITLTISVSFFMMLPNIDLKVVAPLIIGSLISAPFAAYFTKKLPHRALGIIVGSLIMFLSIRTILKIYA